MTRGKIATPGRRRMRRESAHPSSHRSGLRLGDVRIAVVPVRRRAEQPWSRARKNV